jgi:hypothetical protein
MHTKVDGTGDCRVHFNSDLSGDAVITDGGGTVEVPWGLILRVVDECRGPGRDAEVRRLLGKLREVEIALRVPAAEYVPAITDALDIVAAAREGRDLLPTPRDKYLEFLAREPRGGGVRECPVLCGNCCEGLDHTCSHLTPAGCSLEPQNRPQKCNEYLCPAAERVVELEAELGRLREESRIHRLGWKEEIKKAQRLSRERDRLAAWKESALSVEATWDVQAVGKALGVGLGKAIHPEILPGIEKLKAALGYACDKWLQCEDGLIGEFSGDPATDKAEVEAEVAKVRAGEVPGKEESDGP